MTDERLTNREVQLLTSLEEMQERASNLAIERFHLKSRIEELESGSPSVAPEPDWSKVEGARIGDLSTDEHADAYELWLRKQFGFFKDSVEIEFLLKRLDQARGKVDQVVAPSDTRAQKTDENYVIPGDSGSPEWHRESYQTLKVELINAALQANLVEAIEHQDDIESITHDDLLKLTHQLSLMIHEIGDEKKEPVTAFTTSSDQQPDSDDDKIKLMHQDLCTAINRAGRSIGLIATAYRGQSLHDQMSAFLGRIKSAVVTKQMINGEDPQQVDRLRRHNQSVEPKVYSILDKLIDQDDEKHPAPSSGQ